MNTVRPTKWWIGLLLGLWWIGLGHLYGGALRRGLIHFLLYAVASISTILLLKASIIGGLIMGAVVLSGYLASAIDAAWTCAKRGSCTLKVYNRWYILLLLGAGSMLCMLLLAVIMQDRYLEAFLMPGSSMEPSVLAGDRILVDKTAYRNAVPVRGDIVALNLPDVPSTAEDESKITIMKRIVAVGGELVELRGTQLSINGETVHEPYATYLRGGLRNLPPMEVPRGSVVVLGDNRDQSNDSRFWSEPFVAQRAIRGRVTGVYWSDTSWQRIGLRLD